MLSYICSKATEHSIKLETEMKTLEEMEEQADSGWAILFLSYRTIQLPHHKVDHWQQRSDF